LIDLRRDGGKTHKTDMKNSPPDSRRRDSKDAWRSS